MNTARCVNPAKRPALTEFVSRYPRCRKSLRRLIELHEYVENVADAVDVQWPVVGDLVFGFEILAELGSGGMARVLLGAGAGARRS